MYACGVPLIERLKISPHARLPREAGLLSRRQDKIGRGQFSFELEVLSYELKELVLFNSTLNT
jgi:hypothetical protein